MLVPGWWKDERGVAFMLTVGNETDAVGYQLARVPRLGERGKSQSIKPRKAPSAQRIDRAVAQVSKSEEETFRNTSCRAVAGLE